MLAWAWLLFATTVGVVGGVAAYSDPSPLRIEEFSQIYLRLGLSDVVMVTLFLALPLATALTASFVIIARRPDDRGALVLSTGLAALFLFVSGFTALTGIEWLGDLTASVALVLVVTLLAVFPTGTFEPRWSVAAPACIVALCLFRPTVVGQLREMLSDSDTMDETNVTLAAFSLAAAVIIAIFAQMVRYRRISSIAERQQSRWVLLGWLFMLLPVSVLLILISRGLAGPGLTGGLVAASAIGTYLFQAAVVIAVFRYHLYDIDRVVSRTVTYGVVAVVVSSVYVSLVVFLSVLLPDADALAVAGSTLAAAAAFNPIRLRVKRVIERKFNRARYDADQEVDLFVARLSNRVDLETIAADLEDTLIRTLEPAHLAIWTR